MRYYCLRLSLMWESKLPRWAASAIQVAPDHDDEIKQHLGLVLLSHPLSFSLVSGLKQFILVLSMVSNQWSAGLWNCLKSLIRMKIEIKITMWRESAENKYDTLY
mmetsp:Transcript_26753/g.38347  ORF Transcript_26753/g.38347 Transcript_26753/m.38347 type:complete len:105 (-) Transcript_26753:1-315(-)